MTIFVTGTAGFIGSHLFERLLNDNVNVVGVDNFDPFYSRSIKESNLNSINQNEKFIFYEGDLTDPDFCKSLFLKHKFKMVIHLAGKAGVRPSIVDPESYLKHNVLSTLNLLENCQKNQVKNFILASSSSIYGTSKEIPFSEDQVQNNSISPYAVSKISAENYCDTYHNLYGINVIKLRFFTVYGPRQRPDLAIHKFLKSNMKDEQVTVFGDGSMRRDYTYIDDIIQGILGSMSLLNSKETLNETYNLGNSTPFSILELIEEIERVTGKKTKKIFQEKPLGDVPVTFANIEKAKRDLKYRPATPLGDGISKMYQWMQNLNSL